MRISLYIFLLLFLVFSSCTKDNPAPTTGSISGAWKLVCIANTQNGSNPSYDTSGASQQGMYNGTVMLMADNGTNGKFSGHTYNDTFSGQYSIKNSLIRINNFNSQQIVTGGGWEQEFGGDFGYSYAYQLKEPYLYVDFYGGNSRVGIGYFVFIRQ